jgi:hypothetical protein
MDRKTCTIDGCNNLTPFVRKNKDTLYYRNVCQRHHKGRSLEIKSGGFVKYLGCDWPGCTSTLTDMCQVQLDHKNGDSTDNRKENLQMLCGVCHPLKTKLAGDNRTREAKGLAPAKRPWFS